jgi:(2Fe-2S) ferredoxin
MRKGGEEATQAIRDEIAHLGLDAFIHTTRTRCNGRCKNAPVVIVYPEGTWYKEVTSEVGSQIVQQHLVDGFILEDNVIYQYEEEGLVPYEKTECIKGVSKRLNGRVAP